MIYNNIYIDTFILLQSFFLLQYISYICFKVIRLPSPFMLSFYFICIISCSYLGIYGSYLWWFSELPVDKIYGTCNNCYNLNIIMLVFQIWDTIISLIIPELCIKEMIAHHIVTAILTYFVLHNFIYYYSTYFCGVTELSGIALTVVDLFKHIPEWRNKYPIINNISRISFVILFFIFRVIGWPILSYSFWKNMLNIIFENQENTTIYYKYIAILFLLANIFMTFLQFYWAFKLIRFLKKTIYKQ